MLQITLPATRFFNESTEEYVMLDPVTLKLEHSLISIQRWESKWHKSYLSSTDLTREEKTDYLRCMSLDPNIDPKVFERLTKDDIMALKKYMTDPMTGTTFSKNNERPQHKIITAEIIYYWMTTYNIPFECAKWHINQLMTLIRVCSIKNSPKGKTNTREAAQSRAALNKARRARLGSSG